MRLNLIHPWQRKVSAIVHGHSSSYSVVHSSCKASTSTIQPSYLNEPSLRYVHWPTLWN